MVLVIALRNYKRCSLSRCRRMSYAPPFTYRITHRRSGGHHGERSDAQQQRKEEAEAGQEQEERRRSALTVRRHAQPGQTRHLVHEPIRQEALAGDHRGRPQSELARLHTIGPIPLTNVRFGSEPTFRIALTVVRMSFVSRRIPYTCTAPEPVLELPRRDLARRTFGICCLYESRPA